MGEGTDTIWQAMPQCPAHTPNPTLALQAALAGRPYGAAVAGGVAGPAPVAAHVHTPLRHVHAPACAPACRLAGPHVHSDTCNHVPAPPGELVRAATSGDLAAVVAALAAGCSTEGGTTVRTERVSRNLSVSLDSPVCFSGRQYTSHRDRRTIRRSGDRASPHRRGCKRSCEGWPRGESSTRGTRAGMASA